MADIDPKELVQRNIALVVLYVLAIVPIVLWFVLVGGGVKGEKGRNAKSFDALAAKLKKSERQIKDLLAKIKSENPEDRPFTQAHIKKFEELRAAYKAQITELRDVVAKRDGDLDRWFPDADSTRGSGWDKLPKANDYITDYNDRVTALVREYSDLVVPEGGGTPRVYKQPPDKKQMRLYQKRFWIQKYLLQALREATAESKQSGREGARIEQAVRFGELGSGPPPAAEGKEPIVEPIGVSVSLTCLFRDVPKVIERILAQPITFQVLSMKLIKAGFMVEQSESNIRIDGRDTTFADPYYTAELKDHSDFKPEKLDEYIPEPPISLTLELEVLDFNVKKAEAKAEEPPPGDGDDDLGDDDLGDDGEEGAGS